MSTPERRAVEKWLAEWGIHNDGEILGLLDNLERTARPGLDVEALAKRLCEVAHHGTDMDQNGCGPGHRDLAARLTEARP